MKNRRPKSGWLWLTLELIVVFIGVSAGFLFDNYREDRSNRKLEGKYLQSFYNDYITKYIIPYVSRKLDFISGQFVKDFSVDDIEFRNITSGYYVLARQKTEFVHMLDSLNNDLRTTLAARLY